jgi:hypothetical protein
VNKIVDESSDGNPIGVALPGRPWIQSMLFATNIRNYYRRWVTSRKDLRTLKCQEVSSITAVSYIPVQLLEPIMS